MQYSTYNQQNLLQELNKVLANEYLLYATKNYNKIVEGPKSIELYKFFEKQYDELDIVIEAVTDKVKSIKPFAAARPSNYLKQATLTDKNFNGNQNEQLKNLLEDHEMMIQVLQQLALDFTQKFNDMANAVFVLNILEKHQQMASSIRYYLN